MSQENKPTPSVTPGMIKAFMAISQIIDGFAQEEKLRLVMALIAFYELEKEAPPHANER